MCVSKILVKTVSPFPRFEDHKVFVFVGPHPDDIEIAAGASVARLTQMGKEVHYVIVTDGGYGAFDTEKSPAQMAEIRKNEALDAAESLGVKSVSFLGFHDGQEYSADAAALQIAAKLAELGAEIVFAPDPHLYFECHADHIKTGYAAAHAVIMAGNPLAMQDAGPNKTTAVKGLFFYYTDRPNFYFATGKAYARQIEAVGKHKSQFTKKDGSFNDDFKGISLYIKFRNARNGLRSCKGRADCYRALSPLMFHCCAEKL